MLKGNFLPFNFFMRSAFVVFGEFKQTSKTFNLIIKENIKC